MVKRGYYNFFYLVYSGSEEWIMLQMILHNILKHALLNILCNLHDDPNIQGLPTDPKKLFCELKETYTDAINEKVKSNSISNDELSLLFPESERTELDKLPLDLILKLFDICTSYTIPKHPPSKRCVQNGIIAAKDLVQKYQPLQPKDMKEGKTFENLVQAASTVLTDLKSIDELKGVYVCFETTLIINMFFTCS